MLNGSLELCRLTGEVRLGDVKLDQMGLADMIKLPKSARQTAAEVKIIQ
jgi:hypothetical protein